MVEAVGTTDARDRKSVMSFSGNVATAYWNRDNAQANLNRNEVGNVDDNCGLRFAVRDHKLFFQPPSIRPISTSLA